MVNLIQALPLTFFLICIRLINTSDPMQWQIPFMVGGLSGLASIIVYLLRKRTFNRIFLGINLYLTIADGTEPDRAATRAALSFAPSATTRSARMPFEI